MFVITQTQHLRQRHESKQNNFAADNARHRRHNHRHHRRHDRNAAATPAESQIEGVVHVLRDAAALQQRSHHNKQRHRYHRICNHKIINTLHHQSKTGRAEINRNHNAAEKSRRKAERNPRNQKDEESCQKKERKCRNVHDYEASPARSPSPSLSPSRFGE